VRRLPIATPLLLALLCAGAACAETAPYHDFYAQCAQAHAVVLGHLKEGDTAGIDEWLMAPSNLSQPPSEITIAELSQNSRDVSIDFRKQKFLPAQRFLAILEWDKDRWRIVNNFTSIGQSGSLGLFWLHEGKCYRYFTDSFGHDPDLHLAEGRQLSEPDDSMFSRETDHIADEKSLLVTAREAVADTKHWHELLADPDKPRRAASIWAYLLPSLSPIHQRKTFDFLARQEIARLGPEAVPAFLQTLSSRQPGEKVERLIYAFLRVTTDTRTAAPALVALLPESTPPFQYYLLQAFAKMDDRSLLPVIEPYLQSPDELTRETAQKIVDSTPTVTGEELIQKSPIIAPIFFNGSDGTRATARLFPKPKPLRGKLPQGTFTIESAPASDPSTGAARKLPPHGEYLAFLRQKSDGVYVLTTPDSLRKYDYGDRLVSWFPHTPKIPLADLAAEVERIPFVPGHPAP